MDTISFNNVTFTYPMVEGDLDAEGRQIVPQPVFQNFTGDIPCSGLTSIVGPNGCGKSTLMLLASGRLVPQTGSVLLLGTQIASLAEHKKNLVASVIYQNMEFENDDLVKTLLEYVYKNGAYKGNTTGVEGGDLLEESVRQFNLEGVLDHKLTALSKGEIQRVLLAFSTLYGSRTIFMDEPFFALEDKDKKNSLVYLKKLCAEKKTSIFISMHEIDLSKLYSDNVLLMYPNRDMSYGTPQEVLTSEDLEKAYGVPAAMLKHQEDMNRETLRQTISALSANK